MRVLLSLDLSTTASGWAKFCLETGKLLSYGVILPDFKNPKVKGVPTLSYPQAQTAKLRRLAEQVLELLDDSVQEIIIEEINCGRAGRLSQKTLDGFHYILLEKMSQDAVRKVRYFDSDGKEGWRSAQGLKLQLSGADKLFNKERKKLNKKLARGQKKLPLVTQKTLACRYVNKAFGLSLNADADTTHGDMADAIGLGHFYLEIARGRGVA